MKQKYNIYLFTLFICLQLFFLNGYAGEQNKNIDFTVKIFGGNFLSAGFTYKDNFDFLTGIGLGYQRPSFSLIFNAKKIFLKDKIITPYAGGSLFWATDFYSYPISIGVDVGTYFNIKDKFKLILSFPVYFEIIYRRQLFFKPSIGVTF